MNGIRKIIGLGRDNAPDEELGADSTDVEALEATYPDIEIDGEHVARTDYPAGEDDWEAEIETPKISRGGAIAKFVLIAIALLWTGVLVWSKIPAFSSTLSPEQAIEWFVQWSIPVLLLAMVYMLLMRNGIREAAIFADVSACLRTESALLEKRLHHINNELSIAREFLANQSLELESIGRTSTNRLASHAENIQSMIAESDRKMQDIGNVSDNAVVNIEKLRNQMPVISNSAKDVTNQIANAGRTAQTQIQEMVEGFKRVNEFGQACDVQIALLKDRADQAITELSTSMETMSQSVDARLLYISQESAHVFARMDDESGKLGNKLSSAMHEISAEQATSAHSVAGQLENYEASLIRLAEVRRTEDESLAEMLTAMQQLLDQCEERVAQIDSEGSDSIARLAFAISALNGNLNEVVGKLDQSKNGADELKDGADRLMLSLESNAREIDETLPNALARLDVRTMESLENLSNIRGELDGADTLSEGFAGKLDSANMALQQQSDTLASLSGYDDVWSRQAADIDALIGSIRTVREESEQLVADADDTLTASLNNVKLVATEASLAARAALENSIDDAARQLGSKSEEALEKILRNKTAELVGKLESSVNQAIGATHEATVHLKDQLVKVDLLAANLEQRVSEARERAETKTDEDFARRVALLTESLNSTAIDVTKIFSNEVTDTAWASYLRGDRGVFTRRAVKLLDAGEVREISQHYQDDMEFREHVNRYIHDFEAMLRDLLSTRDGGVVGVTLLSSDMGKLYVALAQAIERLRD